MDNSEAVPEASRVSSERVAQNINTVADLIERSERKVDTQQRIVDRVAALIGRPRFVAQVTVFLAAWIAINYAGPAFHIKPFDPPPFVWLQGIVSVGALYTTVIVIASQNRQSKVSEHRDHLELQAILLTEQKTAKIIGLIEELRRDSPHLKNRSDADAEELQEILNPSEVLDALEHSLEVAEDRAGTQDS